MKGAGWVLTVLGVLVFLAGIAAFGLAIWTVGPDSGRWGGTGFLLVILGFIGGCAGGITLEEARSR